MLTNFAFKALGRFPWAIPYVAPFLRKVRRQVLSRKHTLGPATASSIRNKLEDRLIRIDIEPTNICNARCSFCAYGSRESAAGVVSNEDFSFFLERYVEYGGGHLSLTPLVGDPLVDRALGQKIMMARRSNKIGEIGFATNLIGLHKHDTEDLLLSGLDYIVVSTCIGDREMYKRVYGVDRYDLTMQNLVDLIETNNRLGRPVKISIQLRCEKPFSKVFASSDYQRVVRLTGTYIGVLEEYMNWAGLIEQSELPDGAALRRIDDMREPCAQFYDCLQVYVNGDVGMCCCVDVNAELLVGNLHRDSLEDIWRGERVRSFREQWYSGAIPEICKNCSMYIPLSEWMALPQTRQALERLPVDERSS